MSRIKQQSVDHYTPTKTQSDGQANTTEKESSETYTHEVIGTIYGCTFDISTVIPVGTYRIDGRMPTPLRAGMSSIDFQKILIEHSVLNITFSWDVRELAREVFHLLAIGYESFKATLYPHTVV